MYMYVYMYVCMYVCLVLFLGIFCPWPSRLKYFMVNFADEGFLIATVVVDIVATTLCALLLASLVQLSVLVRTLHTDFFFGNCWS